MMKKIISLFIVLIICVTVFPVTAGAYTKTGRYMVSATALNLRAEPVTGAQIDVLHYGDEIEVTEIKDGWAKTTRNGKTGWCSMRYLVFLDGTVYRISEEGISLIKKFEGYYQYAYWDYSQWTIGYGTRCEENEYPNGITEEEADALLRREMVKYEMQVNAFLGYNEIEVTANQFDALVSLTFNIGSNWTNDSLLRTYLINGISNYSEEEITDAFCEFVHAGGEVVQGLVTRRKTEAALFLEGMQTHTHSYSKVITLEPSCTAEGKATYTCSCKDSYEEVLPMLSHILSDYMVTKEPSKTEEGMRMKRCVMCGEELVTEAIPKIMPDVADDSWYYNGVKHCVIWGYISGNEKGMFMPEEKLTREQFVTILARVSGDDISSYTQNSFNDVLTDSWYANAVSWAAQEGYVKGVGNGESFGVGNYITRQELCVMLYRYNELRGEKAEIIPDLSGYRDSSDIASWAKTETAWAVGAGLISSTSTQEPRLSPLMTVTRAQAAKIFMSFDEQF